MASSPASRSPLVAIGVLTVLQKRRFAREQMRSGWMRIVSERHIAVRFVIGRCAAGLSPTFLCVGQELEHPKAIAWFHAALQMYPDSAWIGHADDDVYIQAQHLLHDLRALPTQRQIYGLANVLKPWRDGPRPEMFEGHLELYGPTPRPKHGRIPFLQGGCAFVVHATGTRVLHTIYSCDLR